MVVDKLTLVRPNETGSDVLDTPLPAAGDRAGRSLPYLSGLIAVLFWGTTPAATVLVAHDLASSLIGPSRLLLAAAFLLPITIIFRPPLPTDKGGWIALAINGVVGFGGSFFLQGLGFSRTSTSHAALILACAPVMTAIIQNILSRTFPRPLWLVGSAIALCGETLLIFARFSADAVSSGTVVGDIIVLIGTVTVSIGYVAGARLSARIGLFGATAWSIVFGALFMLPLAPTLLDSLGALTAVSGGALIFLAVFCTLIGFAAWFWALDKGGVSAIAPLQFGQPIVSLVIATMFLGEHFSLLMLVSVGLVLAGVYICRRSAPLRSGPVDR
ncbi:MULTISPECIES: DMT family transporter [unclassified Bradyrhizobium]|uniref:DMT family transporter n=1 Tax=unclassified Bradyrhizobium TaxID=2631580 RepID=UPI0029163DF2|nr:MULTISPECIES: DMT family transporter [unclassified Bradyrhizobium]